MKVRNGFVSNSSSSSFLITVNLLKNKDDVYDIIAEYEPFLEIEEDSCNFILVTKKQINEYLLVNKDFGDYFYSYFAGGVCISKIISPLNDDDYLLCLSDYNHQGDELYYDVELCDCNYYDIKESMLLDKTVLDKLKKLKNDKRLKNIGYSFGAGHD